jgi:hypothetical protein
MVDGCVWFDLSAPLKILDMGATRIPAYPDAAVRLSQPFALTVFVYFGQDKMDPS